MASFSHRGDHAVVTFSDELTWEAATELTDILEILVDHYFYRRIDVVISSYGGIIAALDYYLDAVRRYRAQGVHVRAYVICQAASAGALMLSLADDDRVAESTARLFFHFTRVLSPGSVTAGGCVSMHAELCRVDDDLIGRLVDRALADPAARGPVSAAPSDRRTLERLLGPDGLGETNRPPRLRALVHALDRKVTAALRAGDRRTLERLYRALFEMECWISSRLARVLRLVDSIGLSDRRAAVPFSGRPGLTVPEWRSLFSPSGHVCREVLLRHTLLLGETGSGKTLSGVVPALVASARAPRDALSAVLVIDPKRELGPVLERFAPDRFDPITSSRLVIDLMAPSAWSVAHDLTTGRWQRAAVRILLRAVSFVPTMAARVLVDHQGSDSNAEFFEREGTNLLVTVLAFILMVTRPEASSPDDWLADDPVARAWLHQLLQRAKGSGAAPGPNALALAAWVLDGPLTALPSDKSSIVASVSAESLTELPTDELCVSSVDSRAPNREWLFARVARRALAVWGTEPGEARDLLGRVVDYWLPMVAIDRQYAGVLATARGACAEFADPAVSATLYFGCEPGYAAARDAGMVRDFAQAVGRDGGGRVMVFQPALTGGGTLAAKALKASFFEAVLNDPDRAAGAPDVPLAGYVADECHRFVTSDRVHGEQSFLDTCRSFSAFCVLACQSVSSIEHALSHGGGSGARDSSAVSVLWNNTGSKLFFRSTDPDTAQRVADLSPSRPGLTDVTRVRPLSSLAPGECYAALANGRFERRQLEPFTEPVADRRLPERAPRRKGKRRARGAGARRPPRQSPDIVFRADRRAMKKS